MHEQRTTDTLTMIKPVDGNPPTQDRRVYMPNTENHVVSYTFDAPTHQALLAAAERAAQEGRDTGAIGNEPVLCLAQHLHGVRLPDDTELPRLKPYVQHWHNRALFTDKDSKAVSFTDTWSMLVDVWHRVKYPKKNTLAEAIRRAEEATYDIPELAWSVDKPYHLLARVCYELAHGSDDGTFFFSSYKAGEILGADQSAGQRALKMFQNDSTIIECTKPGNRKRASEYRYIGKRVIENGGMQNKPMDWRTD